MLITSTSSRDGMEVWSATQWFLFRETVNDDKLQEKWKMTQMNEWRMDVRINIKSTKTKYLVNQSRNRNQSGTSFLKKLKSCRNNKGLYRIIPTRDLLTHMIRVLESRDFSVQYALKVTWYITSLLNSNTTTFTGDTFWTYSNVKVRLTHLGWYILSLASNSKMSWRKNAMNEWKVTKSM